MTGRGVGLSGVLFWAMIALSCEGAERPASVDASDAEAPPVLAPPKLQVSAAQLTRIELSGPRGREKSAPVSLSKTERGWQIVSPITYPANRRVIELMVAVLTEIEVRPDVPGSEVTTDSAWLGSDRGLEVKAWVGKRPASHFVVGRSSREMTYVRQAGSDRVFAAVGRIRPIFDKTLDELRDPAITKIPLEQISRVRFENSHGTLEFVADPKAPGEFVPVGPKIPNFHRQRARQQIRLLAGLIAKGFVDHPATAAQTGLFESDTPRARLFSRGEDGEQTVDVWAGARTRTKRLHLRTSQSEQIYLVSAHLESSLLARRSQFARGDEQMKQLQQRRPEAEKHESETGAPKHDHDHSGSSSSPKQVPPKMLSALRAMARQQR